MITVSPPLLTHRSVIVDGNRGWLIVVFWLALLSSCRLTSGWLFLFLRCHCTRFDVLVWLLAYIFGLLRTNVIVTLPQLHPAGVQCRLVPGSDNDGSSGKVGLVVGSNYNQPAATASKEHKLGGVCDHGHGISFRLTLFILAVHSILDLPLMNWFSVVV